MNELHPGAIIDGRYTIHGPLASGGMGAVYRAEHRRLRRPVAIKILRADAHPSWAERFAREARAACALKHPNVVTTFDFGTDPERGHAYLALELIDGCSLADLLRQHGPLPLGRGAHILSQVADALAEAHRAGVVHRDIKPANIMCSRCGSDPDFVTVIDFGIARVMRGPDDLTRTLTGAGEVVGTPSYMAPETFEQRAGPAADVYAVGVLAHRVFTGQRPFPATQIHDLIFQIRVRPAPSLRRLADGSPMPGPLTALLDAALDKRPEARPSMAQLRDGLRVFAEQRSTPTPPLAPEPDTLGATQPGKRALPGTIASDIDHVEVLDSPEPAAPQEGRRTIASVTAAVLLGGGLAALLIVAAGPGTPLGPSLHTAVASAFSPAVAITPREAMAAVPKPRAPMALAIPGTLLGAERETSTARRPPERQFGPVGRAASRASVPWPRRAPERTPRASRVPVRLVVAPFGSVRYAGRSLGDDVVNAMLPPGTRCFEVSRRGKQARRCLKIRADRSRYVLQAP